MKKSKIASIAKKVAIVLLILFIIAMFVGGGVGVWYFFFRSTPSKTYKDTIAAARARDVDSFKFNFSEPSIRALEGSWTSDTIGRAGSWNKMMEGILQANGAPPETIETIESESGDAAKIKIRLRKKKRNLYLVKNEAGKWKIDVLSGINAGISEVARKAKKKKADENPDDKKKEKGFEDEPQRKGWWKGKKK